MSNPSVLPPFDRRDPIGVDEVLSNDEKAVREEMKAETVRQMQEFTKRAEDFMARKQMPDRMQAEQIKRTIPVQ